MRPVGQNKHRTFALCRCDCGTEKWYLASNLGLGFGRTRSCGCWREQIRSESHIKHNRTYTTEYNVWCGIKARCENSNHPRYNDYGRRGIKVCDRWRDSFENFLADMGERPSKDYSIDRIDNDGDYTPDNCRWATRVEQGANMRSNIELTYNGETHNIAEWARILGVTYHTIHKRYNRHKNDITKIIY